MTTAVIASEYNPFHNGHAYHIEETRSAGATHIVAVMSGNFTQRGTPAAIEKRARAKAALEGGVDLVIELPMPYAMATAQRFAFGVACIARGMGCADVLSFGSESGYLSILQAAAAKVDDPAVLTRMNELLATGITFARARQMAVSEICGDEIAEMLSNPNDLLAVEYIRQLKSIGSDIPPFAVKRSGARHDELHPHGDIASASFLRALMRSGGANALEGLMPASSLAAVKEAADRQLTPFDEKKIESAMLAVLRRMTPEEISALPDISEGIENRIYSAIRQACSLDEVYSLIKSKRYTAARIRRIIMSAFLGLTDEFGIKPPPYIRVLGFNSRGREVLAKMKHTATLPVSDSLAYLRRIDDRCAEFANLEARSTDLYTLGLPSIRPCGFDFTANSIRNV